MNIMHGGAADYPVARLSGLRILLIVLTNYNSHPNSGNPFEPPIGYRILVDSGSSRSYILYK